MGINSTEVAYGFGQLGSGFINAATLVSAPAGKVIVAIQFLAETTLTSLISDTSQGDDAAFFSHVDPVAGNGTNAGKTAVANIFPAGMTIFGRWTSFTPTADTDGGVIFYFGK